MREEAAIVPEILTALDVILTAISVFQKAKPSDSARSNLWRDVAPLLAVVRYCKDTHAALQDFSTRTLREFRENTEGVEDLRTLQHEWRHVEGYYKNSLARHVVREGLRSGASHAEPWRWEGQVPQTIEEAVAGVKAEMPALENHIRQLESIHAALNKEIMDEKRLRDIPDLRARLAATVDDMQVCADAAIRYSVTILVFVHDIAFAKSGH